MYSASSDDKVVLCPYNKNHVVPSSSFQRHLVKCEKNYGTNNKILCPYNATHRLSKSEIAEHIETCPTRKIVEASHVERHCTPASTKWKDESSSTSIVEDSWEGRVGVPRNASRVTYVNQNDGFERDEVESLVSSVGIGRGRLIPRLGNTAIKLKFLKKTYNS